MLSFIILADGGERRSKSMSAARNFPRTAVFDIIRFLGDKRSEHSEIWSPGRLLLHSTNAELFVCVFASDIIICSPVSVS